MKMKSHTRREFIKTTALAAATVSFTGALASRVRAAGPDRKIGFALAGLGNLSTHQLAPALQKTRYCRLTGVITGTPAKAEAWKVQYHIPDQNIYHYDNMEKMADNPDIDVVYVVTPNGLHAEHTIKAAKAGKHVFCEKPMEVSVEKCQQMIDACKQAGRLLGIAYRLHFEPNNLECVRLAREKVFGDLKCIEAGFGFSIGDPTQWRLNRALAGGGPLVDVGVYALQATRYLTGEEPDQVSAMTTVTDPLRFKEVEESIVWQMKFPDGILAHCSATYNFTGLNYFKAFAQHGWFELNPAYSYGGVKGVRSDKEEIHLPAIDQFAAEMDDFALCILNHQPTRVPGEEGLRDVKIITAIYEAARTGKTVSIG